MTYGLDSVMIYPCSDCRELGKMVIENELMPELGNCSDEILALLDHEKVGKLMQERECGVFINEHYCVTSSYEPPNIHIKIGKPENCFFRLLIVPEEEKIEQAQWISLPYETEITSDFCNGICLDFQSSLPNLKFDDARKIGTLNNLAKLHTHLAKSKGKKVYGYLKSDVKKTVDEIFSRLAQNESIKKMYELWCEMEQQKHDVYSSAKVQFPNLVDNKEFKSVKNMIVQTVMQMESVCLR